MRVRPVQKGQLKLRHAWQQLRILIALRAKLPCHVLADRLDTRILGVRAIGHQQIQLAVFLHLHAQLVQTLYGRVAGKKVLRPWAEGEDLEGLQTDERTGDRQKGTDRFGGFIGGHNGIGGDIRLQVTQTQIVGAVEQSAVGVAAAVDKVAVALRRRKIHDGAAKPLRKQRFGRFGSEVAQKHDERIAAHRLHIPHRRNGVRLVFHGDLTVVQLLAVIRPCNGLAARRRQADGKAVP